MKLRRYPELRAKKTRTGKVWHYADFYDPTRSPKRKWWSLETTDAKLARRRLAKVGDAYVNEQFDPWVDKRIAPSITVADAVAAHIEDGKSRSLKRSTLVNRERLLRRFVQHFPTGYALVDVQPHQVERFLPGSVSAVTRNAYLTEIKTLASWATKVGHLDAGGGLFDIAPAKVQAKPIEFITFDELRAVERALHTRRLLLSKRTLTLFPDTYLWSLALFKLVMFCGLRLQEAQRLRWRDVRADFSNPGAGGVLHVRNVPASSYQEGGTTKTGSERAVPLVSMAVEVLAERHEVRATEDADEPVLLRPDRRKGPRSFSMDMASKHWRELRDEAGVTSIPLRKLRASCGTFLASRGVPLKHVQQIYGHADVKLTARVYASAYMDDVRGEMERAFGAIAHGTEK